ncbi:ATP-dependent DNA helicase pif1 [Yarrowia sp. E02]|nr:ATP-dependent DNA helicase pif1 [Yarrowia sp. E02]
MSAQDEYRNCVAIFCETAREALERAVEGDSFFLTGIAGSGKSVVLRQVAHAIHLRGKKVAITSTTGLSAQNIGGATIHSWCGMYKNNCDDKRRHFPTDVVKRIGKTDCLIIDEISMASKQLLERVNAIAQRLRKNDRPFGGMQVIFCGDFHQLPPVSAKDPSFRHPAFPSKMFYLRKSQRQEDPAFVAFLNDVRNYDTVKVGAYINENLRRDLVDDADATHLMFTRAKVSEKNIECLQSIEGDEYVFVAKDKVGDSEEDKEEFTKEADRTIEKRLVLKVGAKVIFLINKSGLVNGSTGRILGFMSNWEAIALQKHDSFHSETFAEIVRGVDLSEVTTGEIELNRQRQAYTVPIIRVGRKNHIVFPEKFDCNYGERLQLPLALAYAITIHKSQGLSLDRAIVNLAGCYQHGLVYVALSRVRTRQGLCVRSFSPIMFEETSKSVEAQTVSRKFS